MNKFLVLSGLTLLASCTNKRPEKVYSKLETEYVNGLDLESKVYMTNCLKSWSMNICIVELRQLGTRPQSSGTSVGKIAAGVAIGNILTK